MPVSDIATELEYGKNPPATLGDAIARASLVAKQRKIDATDAQIVAGAQLYFFKRLGEKRRWEESEALAQAVIEGASLDVSVDFKMWVEDLITAKRLAVADHWATAFLEHLRACPQAPITATHVEFWTDFARDNAKKIPKAFALSRKGFARGKRKS